MSNQPLVLPKLAIDGSNWITFRDRLIWIMESQEWELHLTEGSTPAAYTAVGDVNGVTPERRWRTEENAIKLLLGQALPDQIFNQIKSKRTIFTLWEELKSPYENRTEMITTDLGVKFQQIKLDPTKDPRDHFSKLLETREQLASMGKIYSDSEYRAILLTSLPSIYDQTISSLIAGYHASGNALESSAIIKMITEDYDRRIVRSGKADSGPDEAFAANGQRRDKSKVECYNCHKLGHYKSECYAKGGDQEGNRPPRNRNENRNDNRNVTPCAYSGDSLESSAYAIWFGVRFAASRNRSGLTS
jgi:hypothetical protein